MDYETLVSEVVQSMKKHAGSDCIPFMALHQCIVEGNYEAVKTVLSELRNDTYKEDLLNRRISYTKTFHGMAGTLQLQLPLALAAASANTELLQLLLSHGADVSLTDSRANNILHSLVLLSIHSPVVACDMYRWLMQQSVCGDKAVVRHLHAACNDKGLSALELAAAHCVPEILHLILTTEHVYRFTLHRQGLFTKYEYRIPLQYKDSILHMITKATQSEISRFSAMSFFSKEPVKSIITKLEQKYRKLMYMQLVFTIVHFIMYQVYLYLYLSTKQPPPTLFIVAMFAYTFGILVMYVVGSVSILKQVITVKKTMGKFPYVLPVSFVVPIMMFVVTLSILCVADLIGVSSPTLLVVLHSIAACMSCEVFILFLQMSPTFSHMSVMVDKMFIEMGISLIMDVFVVSGFGMGLYVLNAASHASDSVSFLEIFTNIIYETNLMAVNWISPADIYFSELAVPTLARIFYMLCLVECTLLFLNLLIAVFTHQIEDVYKYKLEIQHIMNINMLLNLRHLAINWGRLVAKLTCKPTLPNKYETLVLRVVERRQSAET
jgi:hypothetical protein